MKTIRDNWRRTWVPFLWVRSCSAVMSTAPIEFMVWDEWRLSLRMPR